MHTEALGIKFNDYSFFTVLFEDAENIKMKVKMIQTHF